MHAVSQSVPTRGLQPVNQEPEKTHTSGKHVMNKEFCCCSANEYQITDYNECSVVISWNDTEWNTEISASVCLHHQDWCNCMFSLYRQCWLPMTTSGTEGQNTSVPDDEVGALLSSVLLVPIEHIICPQKTSLPLVILGISDFIIRTFHHQVSWFKVASHS